MDFEKYIHPELVILIPVMYIIGRGLKNSKIPDNRIPAVLGVISVFLSSLWVFATENIYGSRDILSAFFTAITQGVLVSGASVYINQLYVQQNKKDKK